MISLGSLWSLIKESVSQWSEDYAPSMGAALAYYTIFSIAPLLVIAIAVAGFFFGQEAASGEIFGQLRGLLGDEGATAIQGLVRSAGETGKGTFAAAAGIVTLLIGATTVFAELQSNLDRIWDVPKPEKSGLWVMLRGRLLSFGMILGIGFLLLVSLILSAALSALGSFWNTWLGDWDFVIQTLNFVVSFALITGLFAMIYKLLPRAEIGWKDVWVGASVTSLLFSIGKLLIGLYLGKSSVTSGFGAAGSLVLVLVWVYYSAQIFLLGAEFTKAYAYRHGSRMAKSQPAAKRAAPRQADGSQKDEGTNPDHARDGRAASRHLVPMDRGNPPAARAGAGLRSLANFRIAAAIAATVGVVAGGIVNEIRERRVARAGRRA